MPQGGYRMTSLGDRRSVTSARVLLLMGVLPVALAYLACAKTRQVVPPVPPDSFPSDLYHDSVMVTDSLGGRYSRAVIAVHFMLDATQEVRQNAIESVRGIVIGGAVLDVDGYYLVRVPHGDTLEGVDVAIRVLRRTPGVMSVMRIVAPMPVR
jgi:hypothetical protein